MEKRQYITEESPLHQTGESQRSTDPGSSQHIALIRFI